MLAANGSYAPMILNGRMRLGAHIKLRAVRPWYRIVLVEDGFHEVTVAGESMRCGPGSVYLVAPGQQLETDFRPSSRASMLAFVVMACASSPQQSTGQPGPHDGRQYPGPTIAT